MFTKPEMLYRVTDYLPVTCLPVSEVWNMGYSAPWTLLNNFFHLPVGRIIISQTKQKKDSTVLRYSKQSGPWIISAYILIPDTIQNTTEYETEE